MNESVFQPFTDRLSRDIRNDLSESFVTVLKDKSLTPARQTADRYISADLARCYIDYIENRLQCYARALEKIAGSNNNADPLWQSLVLWDEKLFFEVHEILEHAWLQTEGEEKLFLQAMIRAAGVYIKIDAGYYDPAVRIASKALPVLERNRDRLARYTDPNVLIEALRQLSHPPPQLL